MQRKPSGRAGLRSGPPATRFRAGIDNDKVMNRFRRTRPRRVVRTYGRDSLLLSANPLMSALQAALGVRVGLRSEAAVLATMERDADDMARRGYRVVSAEELTLPLMGSARGQATYYRVTYELTPDRS